VDNQGRMQVNVMDLPYKDQILFSKFGEGTALGGTVTIYSDAVPEGKMWVLNSVCLTHDTSPITSLTLGIHRSDVFYYVSRNLAAEVNDTLELRVPIYLKAGDKVRSIFSPVANGVLCTMTVNGYELDLA